MVDPGPSPEYGIIYGQVIGRQGTSLLNTMLLTSQRSRLLTMKEA